MTDYVTICPACNGPNDLPESTPVRYELCDDCHAMGFGDSIIAKQALTAQDLEDALRELGRGIANSFKSLADYLGEVTGGNP